MIAITNLGITTIVIGKTCPIEWQNLKRTINVSFLIHEKFKQIITFPVILRVLGLWCLMPLSTISQLYLSSDLKSEREYFMFLQWSIYLSCTSERYSDNHWSSLYIYHCNDWKMKNINNSTTSMLHCFPIGTIFSLVHLHSYPF